MSVMCACVADLMSSVLHSGADMFVYMTWAGDALFSVSELRPQRLWRIELAASVSRAP